MKHRSPKLCLLVTCILLSLVSFSPAHGQSMTPADSSWDARWAEAGVDGDIYKLAQNGDSLFVAGDFQKRIGPDYYFDLLMLDLSDSTWHDIGFDALGFNRKVEWVHFDEETGTLYAGGLWDILRDIPGTRNLAKWDGNTWSAISGNDLPTGAIYNVELIRRGGENPDELFVAGYFDSIGGIAASSIARYREGVGWDNLGADIKYFSGNPAMRDFEYHRGRLWIGGLFNSVDGAPAKSIAIYDFDTDTWSMPNGGPTNGRIYSLDVIGFSDTTEALLIGGTFTEIDDVREFYRAALYQAADQSWTEPGSGLSSSVLRVGMTLTSIGGETGYSLFLGGAFETSRNGDTLNSLASYNTVTGQWHSIGGGVDGNVRDFTGRSGSVLNDLIVAGSFDSTITGIFANGLAYNTDSLSWDAFGLGTNNAVNDIFIDPSGTKYYVGPFSIFKNGRHSKLVVDGDSVWTPPGSMPFSTNLRHVLARNDTIFIAGTDIEVDGVPYANIVMWDGSGWQPVDTGVTNTIRDMIFGIDSNLYFVTQGGEFAYFDGSQIHNIPVNFERNGYSSLAYALANDSTTGDILIAGGFETVDSMVSKLVVRWTGAGFVPIGPVGVPISLYNENAYAVIADGAGRVFVGGHRFDGEVWIFNGDWSIAGEIALCFDVDDFVSDGCNVWAAGNKLFSAGSCPLGNIARFNGAGWNELGSGVFGPVENLALHDGELYAVGNTSAAGNQFGRGVAVWNGVPGAGGAFTATVAAPGAGDTLTYGNVFEIEYAVDSTELVQVEYSLDSGQTWSIIHNRARPDRKLPWLVPDTNAEFCQVRVANAAAACSYAYSNFFTITADSALDVHWLQRAGGTYYDEPFTIGYHNWQFGNRGSLIWPDSVADSIVYPADFPDPPDTVENFPDWFTFCEAFGDHYCYKNGDPARIRPKALELWVNVRKEWGGSCYGFTQTALLRFKYLSWNLDFFLPPEDLYFEDYDPFYRLMINKYWLYQKGDKFNDFEVEGFNLTPVEAMQKIREGFVASYPRGLSFFWESLDPKLVDDTAVVPPDSVPSVKGHSVVPYKIVNIPDTAGIYYIYVYDNNGPDNENLFVRIDSINNVWQFAPYKTTDTAVGLQPDPNTLEYEGFASDDPFGPFKQRQVSNRITVYTSASESIVLTNSSGQSTGWTDSGLVADDVDALPLYPRDPDYRYQYPPAYYLPADTYRVELSSFTDDNTRISFDVDSIVYTYSRSGADLDHSDRLTIADGISVVNPDPVGKTANLTTIYSTATAERYAQLLDLSMAPDDSTTLGMDSLGALTISNTGSAKEYSLVLWNSDAALSEDEITQSLVPVSVAANSTQRIEPSWGRLDIDPVVVLNDTDQDGSFEDTTSIDVATNVEDDDLGSLPDEFHLGQNYPNPFNPTTTIDFSIPAGSRVSLRVYNVLGREVATLVDRELSAGWHTVDWDGTGSDGSPVSTGVYFYRLVTENRSLTRKMLLLK